MDVSLRWTPERDAFDFADEELDEQPHSLPTAVCDK